MSKRKKQIEREVKNLEKAEPKQLVFTHSAFKIACGLIVTGLIAEIVLGIMVYPMLPAHITSGFAGSVAPYNMIPKSMVLYLFPLGNLALLLMAAFSPKDDQGKRIMETGMSWSLSLLALLFTCLQASAFHIPHMGS